MRRFVIIAAALLGLTAPAARAQQYGDPTSLVEYWYRTYLGHGPDPGMALWVNQLNQGVAPDVVLSTILGSPQYYERSGSTPAAYVTKLYVDLLGRAPSSGELNFWVSRLYTADRQAIADQLLTQNPGVWVGSGQAPAPPPGVAAPPVANPPIEGYRHHDWERDRYRDWDRHRDIYEYRRPDDHLRRYEYHDRRP